MDQTVGDSRKKCGRSHFELVAVLAWSSAKKEDGVKRSCCTADATHYPRRHEPGPNCAH